MNFGIGIFFELFLILSTTEVFYLILSSGLILNAECDLRSLVPVYSPDLWFLCTTKMTSSGLKSLLHQTNPSPSSMSSTDRDAILETFSLLMTNYCPSFEDPKWLYGTFHCILEYKLDKHTSHCSWMHSMYRQRNFSSTNSLFFFLLSPCSSGCRMCI